MKLAILLNTKFHAALRDLSAQPMPLRIALKCKKLMDGVNEELKKFEVSRQEALHKYGKKDTEGKLVNTPEGNVEFEEGQLAAFGNTLEALAQADISLPTIKVDELGDKATLSPDTISILSDVLL